jgi:hypothetical protein
MTSPWWTYWHDFKKSLEQYCLFDDERENRSIVSEPSYVPKCMHQEAAALHPAAVRMIMREESSINQDHKIHARNCM